MSRDTCPRCGNQGLKAQAEKRVMGGDTHTMRVYSCGECGWQST